MAIGFVGFNYKASVLLYKILEKAASLIIEFLECTITVYFTLYHSKPSLLTPSVAVLENTVLNVKNKILMSSNIE